MKTPHNRGESPPIVQKHPEKGFGIPLESAPVRSASHASPDLKLKTGKGTGGKIKNSNFPLLHGTVAEI